MLREFYIAVARFLPRCFIAMREELAETRRKKSKNYSGQLRLRFRVARWE